VKLAEILKMDNFPFVSVIIPVFNDRDRLKICLQALEKQTYQSELYEIIIVDNGSVDNLEELVKQHSQVSLVSEQQKGSYTARNKGISLAKGEVLAFTDSDCIPEKNWLETGVKQLLSIPNCGIVAGKIKIFFQDRNYPTSVEAFDSIFNLNQQKYVEKHHYGATGNLFTFKKIFSEVGYFNASLKSGGDAEWGKRVFARGYSVIYADNTCVEHPARNSLAQLTQKVIRQTRGSYDMNQTQTRGILTTFLLGFKPPLRSAYRKAFLTKLLKSRSRKFKLFTIIILIYYVSLFEKIRLQLGGKSKW
jgi:cellulose synthase/poly-beta-1,6-N-acetylglucosamine synthase-like glycosyltransferase